MNQSRGFLGKKFGNMMSSLDKKALLDLVICLAKDILLKLATKTTSFVLDKFEIKKDEQEKDSLYSFQMKMGIILVILLSH